MGGSHRSAKSIRRGTIIRRFESNLRCTAHKQMSKTLLADASMEEQDLSNLVRGGGKLIGKPTIQKAWPMMVWHSRQHA
jgi:hypothetical protein